MIGFTGTKNEPTDNQLLKLESTLSILFENGYIFRHGDCVGADNAAAFFAKEIGYWVISHPPNIKTFRAFSKADNIMPEKPYLDRNRDIVDHSKLIISVPKKKVTLDEILKCKSGTKRGGTYYTTRYALKTNKQVIMILPNGRLESNESIK